MYFARQLMGSENRVLLFSVLLDARKLFVSSRQLTGPNKLGKCPWHFWEYEMLKFLWSFFGKSLLRRVLGHHVHRSQLCLVFYCKTTRIIEVMKDKLCVTANERRFFVDLCSCALAALSEFRSKHTCITAVRLRIELTMICEKDSTM